MTSLDDFSARFARAFAVPSAMLGKSGIECRCGLPWHVHDATMRRACLQHIVRSDLGLDESGSSPTPYLEGD